MVEDLSVVKAEIAPLYVIFILFLGICDNLRHDYISKASILDVELTTRNLSVFVHRLNVSLAVHFR